MLTEKLYFKITLVSIFKNIPPKYIIKLNKKTVVTGNTSGITGGKILVTFDNILPAGSHTVDIVFPNKDADDDNLLLTENIEINGYYLSPILNKISNNNTASIGTNNIIEIYRLTFETPLYMWLLKNI